MVIIMIRLAWMQFRPILEVKFNILVFATALFKFIPSKLAKANIQNEEGRKPFGLRPS